MIVHHILSAALLATGEKFRRIWRWAGDMSHSASLRDDASQTQTYDTGKAAIAR
jgi:hypothetical protein